MSSSSSKSSKKRIKQSNGIVVDYNNVVRYVDVKDRIKPYDLIGFRGGDAISDFIAYLEKKKLGIGVFSHVGMVVTSEILPSYTWNSQTFELVPGKLYVLESTFSYKVPGVMDNAPDVITDKGQLGVQLRDLEEVIPRYIIDQDTKVAWCPLIRNPINQLHESDADYVVRKRMLKEQFQILFGEYYGRSYELSLISLFGAMFPSLRTLRSGRDAFYKGLSKRLRRFGFHVKSCPAGWQFCSELVGNIYQAIGVIPLEFDPKDVMPVDFLGYDKDGLPALVAAPTFIADWDLPQQPAIVYTTSTS